MAPLSLSLACWDYDRVKALEDGRVRVEGVDLNFINLRCDICQQRLVVYMTDVGHYDATEWKKRE